MTSDHIKQDTKQAEQTLAELRHMGYIDKDSKPFPYVERAMKIAKQMKDDGDLKSDPSMTPSGPALR